MAYDLITPDADSVNEVSQANIKDLYSKIISLPRQGNIVNLPDPELALPRERAPPPEKAMSRWEKFRQKKGLPKKRKRSHLVFDETAQDWVPRYGGYSTKKIQEKDDWVMEVKGNEDPYAEKSKTKQFARLKQTKNEIKNKIRASQEATETMGVLKDKDKQRKTKKVPRSHRNAAEEKTKSLEILNDVLKKKPKLMSDKIK